MMSGGVRDVEIPVCNVDLSTRTSCVHDLVTFWASHADLSAAPPSAALPRLLTATTKLKSDQSREHTAYPCAHGVPSASS